MNDANEGQGSAEGRYQAATAIDEGCSEAIRVCAAMMDAADAIGAHSELCEIREAILRLHVVASAVLSEANRMRQN
ncbi:hypothetical protein B0G73_105180 [Paraburkholderia sp. BL25I1N1]|nr:hypothetical protein B0G73_105180 [Paraburkholderia sp. BL25I1N1]